MVKNCSKFLNSDKQKQEREQKLQQKETVHLKMNSAFWSAFFQQTIFNFHVH